MEGFSECQEHKPDDLLTQLNIVEFWLTNVCAEMGGHLLADFGKTSEGIFLCFVARDFLNSKWPDV